MTPLHHAVINQNLAILKDPEFIKKWSQQTDDLGFTALEIAKYLGHYEAFLLMGGELPISFKLQENGMSNSIKISFSAFEKAFHLQYRPYLHFFSYESLKEIIKLCPYLLRIKSLVKENYEAAEVYQNELKNGLIPSLVIKWIDPTLCYGVFADQTIPQGTFIGEYTGSVRRLFRHSQDQNVYCLHYPTKLWSLQYYAVDALKQGNLMRFINHSRCPNITPLCLVDRGLLHQVFIANRQISVGEQLTFNYGKDFWQSPQHRKLLTHPT